MRLTRSIILFILTLFSFSWCDLGATEIRTIDIEYGRNPKFLPIFFEVEESFDLGSNRTAHRQSLQVFQASEEEGIEPCIILGKNPTHNSGEYASFLIKNIGTGEVLSENPINITLTDFITCKVPKSGNRYVIGTGLHGDSVLVVRGTPGSNRFDSLFIVKGEDRSGDGHWSGSIKILAHADYDFDGRQELFVYTSAGRDIYPRQLTCIELEPFRIEWTQKVSSVISRASFYISPDSTEPRVMFTSYGPQNGAVDDHFDDQYGYLASIGPGGEVLFTYRTLANFGSSVLTQIDSSTQIFCFYHNQLAIDGTTKLQDDSTGHWLSLVDSQGNILRTTEVPEMIRSIWSIPVSDLEDSHIFALGVHGTVLEFNSSLQLVAISARSDLHALVGRARLAGEPEEVLIFATDQGLNFYSPDFDLLGIYENKGGSITPLLSRAGNALLLVITGSNRDVIIKVGRRNFLEIFITAFQEHQELVLTILFILAIGLVLINILRLRTSRRLAAREQMLSSLFENMQDGFYQADLDGVIIWASPSCMRLLGYEDNYSLVGINISEAYVDPEKRKELVDEISKKGRVTDWIVELKRADGKQITVSTNSNIYYDKNGKVAGIEGVFRDITHRLGIERALKSSEEQYRSLVENVRAGISLVTQEGIIEFTNEEAAALFDQPPEGIIGQSFYDLLPALFAEEKMKVVREVIRTQEDYFDEAYTIIKGKGYWFQVHVQPYHKFNGGSPMVVIIAYDITEQKNAGARIRLLSSAVEQSNEGLGVAGIDGIVTFVNDAMAEMHGLTQAEMEGQHITKFYPLSEEKLVMDAFQEVMEKGWYSGELLHLRKDGTIFPTWQTNSLLRDENKKVIGSIATILDITERKRAEEALRDSEEKYRGIFDESVATVYMFDVDKNFIDSNQAGLDLLGYSKKELLSMSIPDVDVSHEKVKPAHKKLLSGDRIVNYEHQLRRKDGRVITVLNNSIPLTDAEGTVIGMQSTLIDISERKKAEEALRHRVDIETLVASISTEFISMPVDEIDDGIGKALQKVGEFIGADRGYIFWLRDGGEYMDVTYQWHSKDVDSAVGIIEQMPLIKVPWWSAELLTLKHIAISSPSELPPEAKIERQYFESLGTKSVLAVSLSMQGTFYGSLHFSCIEKAREWPIEDIKMLKVIGEIFVNAMEQKHKTEEVVRVNKERIEQERQIAGGFAHEIRNALFPARGMLEKLVKSIPEEDASDKNLTYSKMVDDSVSRAIDIVSSIMSYTRLGTQRAEEDVLLFETINQVINANQLSIENPGIKVEISGEKQLAIKANRQQFYMVINNLVLNAIDAMQYQPEPVLVVKWISIEDGRVEITVQDNGQGMTSEVKSKIFEAFYSTKPDRGTGLGLATVMKIVTMYDGTLDVKSKIGHGTTFRLIFKSCTSSYER